MSRPGDATRSKPTLVAAADWSTSARKRWLAPAVRDDSGAYTIHEPEPVGDARTLIARLRAAAGRGSRALVGFDFPIGLPRAYAARARIGSFREGLKRFGAGAWARFFEVTDRPGLRQPFGPASNAKCGLGRAQLAGALGLSSEDELFRACDRKTGIRHRAETVFFTRFAKQVGRATIHGWRGVLQPSLDRLRLWPFDGDLETLLRRPGVVVAEIYPTEAAARLGLPLGSGRRSKMRPENRRTAARRVAAALPPDAVRLTPGARRRLEAGCSSDDEFDALVGVASMLLVVVGRWPCDCPADPHVRRVEGWILGQASERAAPEDLQRSSKPAAAAVYDAPARMGDSKETTVSQPRCAGSVPHDGACPNPVS